MTRQELTPGWYIHHSAGSPDLRLSGVYEWRIEGVGIYVGKAKVLQNRILAYPRNVRRMMEGLPWHGNPDKEYRRVHKALLEAYQSGRGVSVCILEICPASDRKAAEDRWIALRRLEAGAGGLALLND